MGRAVGVHPARRELMGPCSPDVESNAMARPEVPREEVAAVVGLLRSLWPPLPDDLRADLDTPLAQRLDHGTFQTLVAIVRTRAPHLDRAALLGANLRDLVEWLAPVLTDGRTAARPPAGSYRSPSTTLRPLEEPDVVALYRASLDPATTHRWRFRGRVPSPDEFRALLFDPAVLAQLMVVTLDRGAPVGLVAAYDADLSAGHCSVAIQRLNAPDGAPPTKGLMIEGFLVFVQYLFDHFSFRKLYVEVPEYNATLVRGSMPHPLRLEGELHDHFAYGDRTWSKLICSLSRHDWDAVAGAWRAPWPTAEATNQPDPSPARVHERSMNP